MQNELHILERCYKWHANISKNKLKIASTYPYHLHMLRSSSSAECTYHGDHFSFQFSNDTWPAGSRQGRCDGGSQARSVQSDCPWRSGGDRGGDEGAIKHVRITHKT